VKGLRFTRVKLTDYGPRADGPPPAPLRVSQNGRCLEDEHGHTVFLLADTAWSLAMRVPREEVETYLRKRRAQRFNAVTFVLYAPGRTALVDGEKNVYGDAAFATANGKADPARPLTTDGSDPSDAAQYDYWDQVDHTLDLCRRLGLYAIVLPTWGSGVAGDHGGGSTGEIVFNEANAHAYGRWLGERYRDQKHVIWMLGGDRSAVYGERDYRPVFRAMAEGLADGVNGEGARDGKADYSTTLMSYHPRKDHPKSSEWFHGDAWLDFNSIQDWPEAQIGAVSLDRNLSPTKPTWLFEGRYEGYWKRDYKPEDWGEWQCRQQAWQTVLGGAFGHTYGHERVFGFGRDGADWRQHLDSPGARSMTHLARLMNCLKFEATRARVPDQSLLDGDAGKAERLKSDSVTAARTENRRQAIFYTANGRPVRARLDQLAAGKFFAWWFNPRTGGFHSGEKETSRQKNFATGIATGPGAPVREFTPPTHGDGQDWVLVLSAAEGM
jgi:hypothetical protein